MLNTVNLIGRLTKDVEVKKTTSNKSVVAVTIAVNDKFNKEHTDFINCVFWNQSAEYLGKYANKGDLLVVSGRISTRSYDSANGKVYVTEVVAHEVSILSSKKAEETVREQKSSNEVDINPDDLPFF